MNWVTSAEFKNLADEMMLAHGYTVSQIARVLGVPYAVVDCAMKGRSQKVRQAYFAKLKAHHDSLLLVRQMKLRSASLCTAEILFHMLRPYLEGRSWCVIERSERCFCIESYDHYLSLFCRGEFRLVLFSSAPESLDDELFRFSDCRKEAHETFVKLARRISELPNVARRGAV